MSLITLKKDFADGDVLYGEDLNGITAPVESAINLQEEHINLKADKTYVDNIVLESGTGDMVKVMYDPDLIEADVFDIDNQKESVSYKKLTAAAKTKLDNITLIDNLLSTDSTKYLSAKQGNVLSGGWIPLPTTLGYASVDIPTGIVTTGADTRGYLSEGMKIKYDQAEALTAYWTFNSSNAPDIGAFTMTNIGTPTYSAGKFSNALTLNGTDQALTITDTALMKPTGAFTIGMWFKTNRGDGQLFWSRAYDGTNSQGFRIGINDAGKLNFNIARLDGATNTSADLNGQTVVTDNNLHNVVVTFNNNYAQIYLDGKLEVGGWAPTPSYFTTNYVRIGNRILNGSNDYWFLGLIDDLYFRNGYALDEKTIRDKYNSQTAQGTSAITVTKNAFISATPISTELTLYHGTDFMLSNSPITNIYYSNVKSPYGWNNNPDKWSVLVTDATLRSLTSATSGINYADNGSVNIVLPIGYYDIYLDSEVGSFITNGSASTLYSYITKIALSDSNSAWSNLICDAINMGQSYGNTSGTTGNWSKINTVYKGLKVPLKKLYYLGFNATGSSGYALKRNYDVSGHQTTTIIKAVSNYL
jgi:hypothetical protein